MVMLALWTATLLAQQLSTSLLVSGIDAPTDIQHAGDGSGRLFLVQQNGLIRVWSPAGLQPKPFLDIRHKTIGEGESGLLGLAFPPSFASSGRFFVNYTDLKGDTIIGQYTVPAGGAQGDPLSEVVILKIAQPFGNHNGGQIRFGPDGYLYIGMGDGGDGGDPFEFAQNMESLLGKMLRIDVESAPGGYRVPPDNPFVGGECSRPEIWSLGLRNPWRFSFDRATGDLWIGDVGQDSFEEVNHQPAASRGGENYGWNRMEGAHCFLLADCAGGGTVRPVAEYTHQDGCSVTGGFVHQGIYYFGDYCDGRIYSVRRDDGLWRREVKLVTGFNITTFGEDADGGLYVADAATGTIYRLIVKSD